MSRRDGNNQTTSAEGDRWMARTITVHCVSLNGTRDTYRMITKKRNTT